MLASFIPFFIAANLATDTLTWSNGPEYVFNATYDVYLERGNGDDGNITIIVDIRCQPKDSDSLICLATETGQIITSETTYDRLDDNVTIPVEAKFDANGIVHLIVPESISSLHQMAVKRFASLFSIGVDLSNLSVTNAEGTTEKSVFGECEDTVIKVEAEDASENPEHLDGQNYDLYPIAVNKNGRRMNVVIDKIRDTSKCSAKNLYHGIMDMSNKMEIQSSVSKIRISDSGNFETTTATRSELSMPILGITKHVIFRDRIRASLSEVREAVAPIPSIPDPKIISIEMLPEDVEASY